jgi:hypothetical protein
MSNQLQFARQTAAALLAFGLIASLLPGLAVAQDLSTRESLEKDWEWVREQPGEWQWKDGVLRLRTQPGGVWGPAEPAKNVLVSKSVIEHTYEVDGNKVRGWWRKDDDSQWTEAAVCQFPEDLKSRFAIFTQTGPVDEVRWATVKRVDVN